MQPMTSKTARADLCNPSGTVVTTRKKKQWQALHTHYIQSEDFWLNFRIRAFRCVPNSVTATTDMPVKISKRELY